MDSVDPDCEVIEHPCALTGVSRKRFCVPKGDILGMFVRTARYTEFVVQIELYRRFGRGGSMVEVGANIGTDTVVASDFFRTCYAFEPSSRNVSLLRKNLELNGVSNVRIFPVAVGQSGGSETLYLGETNNLGGANLNPEDRQSRRGEAVQVVTLDSAMPENVRDITYMHIDTEGHDIQVLKGACGFLSRQEQRPMIRMEFQPRALSMHGTDISELIGIMDRFQYTPKFNASGHLVNLSRSILREIFELWQRTEGWIDILLCP